MKNSLLNWHESSRLARSRMMLALLCAIAVVICFPLMKAQSADLPELMLGPTFSIRGRMTTEQADTLIADMKDMGVNTLIVFRQELGREFRDKCDKAGITLVFDTTGRTARKARGGPDQDYYEHSFAGGFASAWSEYLKKIAGSGSCQCYGCVPDEMTWNNAQLGYTCGITPPDDQPFYARDEASVSRFKKETGLHLPEFGRSRILDGSDPAQRKYAVLRYHWHTEALKKWAEILRKSDPDVAVSAVLTSIPCFGLERYSSGFAWDLLGDADFLDVAAVTAFTTGYDNRGLETHFIVSETAKTLAAAFPAHTRTGVAICLYSTNDESDPQTVRRYIDGQYLVTSLRPVDIYGTVIAAAYQGAKLLSCYDGRYVARDSSNYSETKRTALKSAYEFLAGAKHYLVGGKEVPEILVLISRASEDYWQLDNAEMQRDIIDDGSAGIWEVGGWAQPANRSAWQGNVDHELSRGFRTDNMTMRFLFKNGYPFSVEYLDRIEKLDLSDARVILLPFPYSVPDAVVARLKAAAERGAQVLIFNRMGELNAKGDRRKRALLETLAGVKLGPYEPVGRLLFKEWKKKVNVRTGEPRAVLMPVEGMSPSVLAETDGGKPFATRLDMGDGAIFCFADMIPDEAADPAGYSAMEHVTGALFIQCKNVPVPLGKARNVEACYRQLEKGAFLGLVNWNPDPVKLRYALPGGLAGSDRKIMFPACTESPVVSDDKDNIIEIELPAHGVAGIGFSTR